ncbi:MAG: hypothetical protein ACM3RP_01330 [Chitinophagales bacterium]
MPGTVRRALGMGLWTFPIAVAVALISNGILAKVGTVPAFSLLAGIILVHVLVDIVGTAVTAAEEAPFHAMAANRVAGAREAINLVRRADRVANVANDLFGDIFGTIGGAVSAAIVVRLAAGTRLPEAPLSIVLLALVAAVTVGAKAAAKTFAINQANEVIFLLGRILYRLGRATGLKFGEGERRSGKGKGRGARRRR